MVESNDRPQLFWMSGSPYSWRAMLTLEVKGVPYESRLLEWSKGDLKTPEFLALNPFAQVPVIEDGDAVVADSNAILTYLALRYDPSGRWLPCDPTGAARVQRWLSVAAGSLAVGPARARANVIFGRPADPRCVDITRNLFGLMEAQLGRQPFLAASEPTIADVALYSYTAHAPEGGMSLQAYPRIRDWLARIEALPGFVGMVRSPVIESVL